MTMLQKRISVLFDNLETAIESEKFVRGGNPYLIRIESNAAEPPICATSLPFYCGVIPAQNLVLALRQEINYVQTVMAFTLVTRSYDGG